MKKAIVLFLSLVLVIGMALPAAAAGTTIKAPVKDLMESTAAKESKCTFLSEAEDLTEEQMKEMTEALKAEKDAAVKGMGSQHLFYFSTSEEPTTVVFNVAVTHSAIVKQFVDGKWVTRQVTVDRKTNTITVKDAVSGPMMILLTVPSPTATQTSAAATSLLPVFVSATSDSCVLYSVKEAYKLSPVARSVFEEAQDALKDAVPEGMVARYFFYVYTAEPCTMVLKVTNCTEVVVKQYLEGKWAELKSTLGADGNLSIENVVTGPMAIFTK